MKYNAYLKLESKKNAWMKDKGELLHSNASYSVGCNLHLRL